MNQLPGMVVSVGGPLLSVASGFLVQAEMEYELFYLETKDEE